jgi:16S rRNA C967 or C1407 C5-methylase (RsmB/RsmF family)/NOL1/NOP2/fmu family ribosome biogenesis protein
LEKTSYLCGATKNRTLKKQSAKMELPKDFETYTRRLLGDEEYGRLVAALAEEPPVSVRFNPLKVQTALFEDMLNETVPWASNANYLTKRANFTFDPLFHAGCYYVQEASSMFLEQALRRYVNKPVLMLDLCAAPGGKSTLARSVLPEGSMLVSNEPLRQRAQILAENMTKWGHPDTVVTQNYPADFASLGVLFDVVAADVPCSGEGMFRKDAQAVTEWSKENVALCRDRQREILRGIWAALRPGGLLIYSTCTFNRYEDEENVAWIAEELGADVLPVCEEGQWGCKGYFPDVRPIGQSSGPEEDETSPNTEAPFPVYHFLPGTTKGEGFFLAVLRKHGNAEDAYATLAERNKKNKKKDIRKNKTGPTAPSALRQWVGDREAFQFLTDGDGWTAVPRQYADEVKTMQARLNVLQAGTRLCTAKGGNLVPDIALALSTALNKEAFPRVEVDYRQAIGYLRHEAIALAPDTPLGYVLICYKGQCLGFAKNIGNRANNLYPEQWRIRSGHLPAE